VLAVLAATLVSSLAAGGAAAARGPRLVDGDPLQRLRAESGLDATRVARQHGPRIVAKVSLPRRTVLVWLALVSVSTLAVMIPAVQSKRPLRLAQVGVPSPEGGVQMRRFSDRKVEHEASESAIDPEAPSPVERVADYTGGLGGSEGAAYADLGRHVASVLEAAQEAAERMKAEARSEATRVGEEARKEAEATLAEAHRKADELEAETGRIRSEATSAADDVRARADVYAEDKRAEADEAAERIVGRAERAARERARAAEERQRALDQNVVRTEERLRQLVSGLRELAGRLDVLVASDGLPDSRPEDAGEAAEAGLDDSLRRAAAARQSPEEAAAPAEEATAEKA
jgi:hypothetical protein